MELDFKLVAVFDDHKDLLTIFRLVFEDVQKLKAETALKTIPVIYIPANNNGGRNFNKSGCRPFYGKTIRV